MNKNNVLCIALMILFSFLLSSQNKYLPTELLIDPANPDIVSVQKFQEKYMGMNNTDIGYKVMKNLDKREQGRLETIRPCFFFSAFLCCFGMFGIFGMLRMFRMSCMFLSMKWMGNAVIFRTNWVVRWRG